jgi:small-conductance mechanosensitive channel
VSHPRAGRALLALCLVVGGSLLAAQTTPAGLPSGAAIHAEPSATPATLAFFNRPIVLLRARVLGREPAERADGARRALDALAADGMTGPVARQSFDGGSLITVAGRAVLALTPPDVEELSGETVEGAAALVAGRMQRALDEAAEARAPLTLVRSGASALAVLVLSVMTLWGLARARRAVRHRIVAIAEHTVTRVGLADVDTVRALPLPAVERGVVTVLVVVLDLVVIYAAVGFVLRRFPYTRLWGESMREFVLAIAKNLALGAANAVPGLLTVLIIVVIARFVVRLVGLWFSAIESGRLAPRWIYPETAQPTRRLATALVWVFAIVVAYPYLPGSQTDAFKGVSVFLGLMVTFGSSGLVNQIMSGFMITYSRALRAGDFVRVGDVEGTVTQIGVLSTKLKTLKHEEVTIPNAVVVAQTATDYSRTGDIEGVLTPTSVTIGYDTPWRQVHSLLLLAAERTAGLRQAPAPVVLQAGLEDFYVKYTLLFSLERQQSRPSVMDALHANIQDLFNEYGVQIMSPNYVMDPTSAKVVQRQQWFAAPASPAPARSTGSPREQET